MILFSFLVVSRDGVLESILDYLDVSQVIPRLKEVRYSFKRSVFFRSRDWFSLMQEMLRVKIVGVDSFLMIIGSFDVSVLEGRIKKCEGEFQLYFIDIQEVKLGQVEDVLYHSL